MIDLLLNLSLTGLLLNVFHLFLLEIVVGWIGLVVHTINTSF